MQYFFQTMKRWRASKRIHFVLMVVLVVFTVVITNYQLPITSYAQTTDLGLDPIAETSGLGTVDVRVTVGRIIQVFLGLLGTIGLVLVLYGGYMWMTAAGNEKNIETAKKILTSAVIGLVIVLAAFSITTFIVSRIIDATGARGVGVEGINGGGGIGSGGTLPGNALFWLTMLPTGPVRSRNFSVTLHFSHPVDGSLVPGRIFVRRDSDQSEVPGQFATNGQDVVFTPSVRCPAPNETRPCFEENAGYFVTVTEGVETGLRSTDGRILRCGIGNDCRRRFQSGDLIDVEAPNIAFTAPQPGERVSVDAIVPIEFTVRDDIAVGDASIDVDGEEIGMTMPSGGSTSNFWSGSVDWNTETLDVTATYALRARARDLSGNEDETPDERSVGLIAAHCRNNRQDADETGPDCGGQECEVCSGAQCQRNTDCQSGLCVNNRCIGAPLITNIEPRNGAAGNLLTLTGEGFGTTPGRVRFMNVGGDPTASVEAALPQSCSVDASWTNTQVIITVPENLTDPGSVRLFHANATYDDSLDGRGPQMRFEPNDIVRPGICSVDPNRGVFGTPITVRGTQFGTTADSLSIGGVAMAGTLTWANDVITGGTIPNIAEGETDIVVEQGGENSNPFAFTVALPEGMPRILSINPVAGTPGTYVMIRGSNFGSDGRVQFIDDEGVPHLALRDFPQACRASTWSNDELLVKAPAGTGEGNYSVRVVGSGDAGSNQVDFRLNDGVPPPGLCRIEPDNGPFGTPVTLSGERFGDARGVLRFFEDQRSDLITTWADGAVSAQVPARAESGPVAVIDAARTVSNTLPFRVQDCREGGTCNPGQECCGNGSCSDSCTATGELCSYEWIFSTGPAVIDLSVLCPDPRFPTYDPVNDRCTGSGGSCIPGLDCPPPGGLQCAPTPPWRPHPTDPNLCVDGACPPTPPGMICDEGILTCPLGDPNCSVCTEPGFVLNPTTRRCEQNCNDLPSACSGTTICEVTSGFCVETVPHVVERQECRQAQARSLQSPSPFDGQTDACPNAAIAVLFTRGRSGSDDVMNNLRLQDAANISLVSCGQGSSHDACTGAPIPLRFDSFLTGLGNEEGARYVPGTAGSLTPGLWYRARLRGGESGFLSSENVPIEDYEWFFKTGSTNCQITGAQMSVSSVAIVDPSEQPTLTATHVFPNCNQSGAGAATWTWSLSGDSPAIMLQDIGQNSARRILPRRETVNPAVVTASSGGFNAAAGVTIAYPAPVVTTSWPRCEQACTNIEVGARFSRPIDTSTLITQNVHVVPCSVANPLVDTARLDVLARAETALRAGEDAIEAGRSVARLNAGFQSLSGTAAPDADVLVAAERAAAAAATTQTAATQAIDSFDALVRALGTRMSAEQQSQGILIPRQRFAVNQFASQASAAALTQPMNVTGIASNTENAGLALRSVAASIREFTDSVAFATTCTANDIGPAISLQSIAYNSVTQTLRIVPVAAQLQPATLYRVLLRAGSQGVRGVNTKSIAVDNAELFTFGGSDYYSWTFRTKPAPATCAVETIRVEPTAANVRTRGPVPFSAIPMAGPDACSPIGQRIDPTAFTWGWSVSDASLARILTSSGASAVASPLIPTPQGTELARISAATEGRSGFGTLSLACGFTSNMDCPVGFAVDRTTCCSPQPRVIMREPEQSANLCRNGAVIFEFTEVMDMSSLTGNITFRERNGDAIRFTSTSVEAGTRMLVTLIPERALAPNETYDITMSGLRSALGVPLVPPSAPFTFRTTSDICTIDHIVFWLFTNQTVDFESAFDAKSDEFICAGDTCIDDVDQGEMPGNQHFLWAIPVDVRGLNIVPTRTTWEITGDSIATVFSYSESFDYSAYVTSTGQNGQARIIARASIGADAPVSGTLPVRSRICTNPWPSASLQSPWNPNTRTAQSPAFDPARYPNRPEQLNFSLWYCLDAGDAATTADDLPAINYPPILVPPSSDPNVLREYLLPIGD